MKGTSVGNGAEWRDLIYQEMAKTLEGSTQVIEKVVRRSQMAAEIPNSLDSEAPPPRIPNLSGLLRPLGQPGQLVIPADIGNTSGMGGESRNWRGRYRGRVGEFLSSEIHATEVD